MFAIKNVPKGKYYKSQDLRALFFPPLKTVFLRTSRVVQRLRICIAMLGTQV